MTRRRILFIVVLVGILAFLTIVFSLTFFLTAFIYDKTGQTLPPLLTQLINSFLGLLFVILSVGALGYFFRSKQVEMQRGVFGPILDAMERITKGDFSVRLNDDLHNFRANEPVGLLVKSVNTMAQELNQMETLRQEFISNASHEIQSPLTSIHGFARALQNETISPDARRHYLNIIETESMRLSKLGDNLLALTSLETENRRFEPKPYRVDKQIRDLILSCEPQWVDKAIEMNVEVEPVILTADEDLLSQVWLNLIHNSIKFTPAGGRVCVDLHPHDGIVEFKIADTGIGISEQDQARIFERFFKADKSRDRSKSGSGLGLAIAKKIIDLHQGTIAVSSRLGEGAVFVVTLPMAA